MAKYCQIVKKIYEILKLGRVYPAPSLIFLKNLKNLKL